MILAAGPVQKAGLESCVTPCVSVARALRWRWRLGVVLAVHPRALDVLKGVLPTVWIHGPCGGAELPFSRLNCPALHRIQDKAVPKFLS